MVLTVGLHVMTPVHRVTGLYSDDGPASYGLGLPRIYAGLIDVELCFIPQSMAVMPTGTVSEGSLHADTTGTSGYSDRYPSRTEDLLERILGCD